MMRFETILMCTLILMISTTADAKRWPSLIFSDPCLEKRTCPKNERFICCGTCVEPTCSKPKPTGKCTDLCIAGCFCKPKFIRRVIGGPCVLANSCPKPRKTTKNP
uniref:TIL domain-containing protein n=1 Tax=Anopheles minimus TaxID=112268 RepID=A0A182VXB4_9DIPT